MGTYLNLVVEASDRPAALEASEAIVASVEAAETRLSTWTDASELSRVNHAPVGQTLTLSPLLARDLQRALECAEATDGAFTPGIGPLVRAWGLRTGGRQPSADEVDDARRAGSLDNVRFEGDRVERKRAGFAFEEGGFGKGAGLDDARAALAKTNATGAVLDLGGQVAVWGGAQTEVSIADPRRRDRAVLKLNVSSGSVATSGNSERGIVVDGQRHGHLLDPRTGRPSPDFGSVTVWAADGATADCLATGLFVMGPDDAMCWASARDDVAVVIVRKTDDGLEALASPQLEGRLVATADDLSLRFQGEPPDCTDRE